MNSRINEHGDRIDRRTSRSICDAVGERLQQVLRPEPPYQSPPHLQHLIDEFRRREAQGQRRSSNRA